MVFSLSLLMLFFGDELDQTFNVIGIRVAAIFIAFAAFLSSMLFSLLILLHNRTAVRMNDDTNKRAELFREQQFASTNYSIIDFMDRMLIYAESERYIGNVLLNRKNMNFHMIESLAMTQMMSITRAQVNIHLFQLEFPFKILEGKLVSFNNFDKLRFEA